MTDWMWTPAQKRCIGRLNLLMLVWAASHNAIGWYMHYNVPFFGEIAWYCLVGSVLALILATYFVGGRELNSDTLTTALLGALLIGAVIVSGVTIIIKGYYLKAEWLAERHTINAVMSGAFAYILANTAFLALPLKAFLKRSH